MHNKLRWAILFFADIVGVVVCINLLFWTQQGSLFAPFTLGLGLFIIIINTTMLLSGTYLRSASKRLPKLPLTTFFKALLAVIPCVLISSLLPQDEFLRQLNGLHLIVLMALFACWATVNRLIVNRLFSWQQMMNPIVYLGYSNHTADFLQQIHVLEPRRSIFIATDQAIELPNTQSNTIQLVSLNKTSDDLAKLIPVGEVVVDPNFSLDTKRAEYLVSTRLSGFSVRSLSDFFEEECFKMSLTQLKEHWFLRAQGFAMIRSQSSLKIKRLFDILFALLLLLFSAPLIVIAAIAVKCSSSGPVFFVQNRVGLNGNIFRLFKLRTMQVNAEAAGAQWAEVDDSRITTVGHFLRHSRLDELPQCWNVLQGHMSFIGPRPERPEFTSLLADKTPYYDLRHLVKPGLTGWAQVMYPYAASEDDSLRKLEYDLYYIKHQSILFDMNILLRTLFIVLQRVGR